MRFRNFKFLINSCVSYFALLSALAIIILPNDKGFIFYRGHYTHIDTSKMPFKVRIHPTVMQLFAYDVQTAMQYWNDLFSNDFFIPDGVAEEYTDKDPGIVHVFVKDLSVDMPGAAGVTRFFINKKGNIISAMIIINAASAHRFEQILTHEFGHVIGLDDDKYPGSIMHWQVQHRSGYITKNDLDLIRGIL